MPNLSQGQPLALRKLTLSAVFLAVAQVLPMITGGVPLIGNMLLPMHYPVILCGMICGWPYGLIVGFTAPLLRSLLFGMPVLYPSAIAMAFELAAYGTVCGLLTARLGLSAGAVFTSLVTGMVAGRLVWGICSLLLYSARAEAFTLSMFLAGALFHAFPGILFQLILIPLIMTALHRARLIPISRKGEFN